MLFQEPLQTATTDGLDRMLDIRISRLRKKSSATMPRNPERIKTIWGQGYLFVAGCMVRYGTSLPSVCICSSPQPLAVVSWGQDRLLQAYSGPDTAEDKSTAAVIVCPRGSAAGSAGGELETPDRGQSRGRTGLDMEIFASGEIAGPGHAGEPEPRRETPTCALPRGESWVLKSGSTTTIVLALKSPGACRPRKGPAGVGVDGSVSMP